MLTLLATLALAAPQPTPGPDVLVYGYQAYWAAELQAVPWDDLSHIALFAAELHSDGSLSSTSRWDEAETAVALAEPYGVRVHLCAYNFEPSQISALLSSETARARAVEELAAWVQSTGAHGVNIDLEGTWSSDREELVAFAAELDAAVDEVVFATPSVDWSDAWDYAALSEHAWLFIMGYGYHWSGSSHAGPVDPLYGGDPWSHYSLDWTAADYLDEGADPDRIILGLPLYGYAWTTHSEAVPATAQSTGEVVFWDEGQEALAAHGRHFDEVSRSPWYYDGSAQGWIGDASSLGERVEYAVDMDLGGVGFWALHYDGGDEALWSEVREHTVFEDPEEPEPSEDWTAYAGEPFLAYPGDTVILSARGSTGPEDAPMSYRWSQVSGSPVVLDAPSGRRPSFEVEEVGTLVFELSVGHDSEWSAPARSYVVVIDREAGSRYLSGCQTGSGGAWWLGLGLLPLLRRREER